MRELHLIIVTPDGIEFDGQVESVLAKTDVGDVEILAGHAEYFASLAVGKVKIKSSGTSRLASSSGGFLSVSGGEVKLVATTFEFADDIDLNRAKAAKEKAEQAISAAKDARAEALAKAKLSRALSRISVAEHIKTR